MQELREDIQRRVNSSVYGATGYTGQLISAQAAKATSAWKATIGSNCSSVSVGLGMMVRTGLLAWRFRF